MTPTVLHPFRYTPSRRNVRGAVSAVLLAALTCDAPSLAAQAGTTTGVIRGSVRDPAGDPVPGTAIVIQNRETDLLTTVETSSSGTFVRTLLPPGTYDLTVAPATAGFGTERIEGAVLRVGGMLDLTVELRIVVTETVTVVSEAPAVIDTTDVTRSQRIQEDVVDGLPSNGRNYLNLTLLTPGASISQGPDGDELNIGGQRGIFNNFIVDGADFNNPFFGEQRGGQRPAFTFNQDAIEDLVVVNQGATAEFGRSAGGFVNVITKSGTNDFSGSAHYFGQWDEIAAPYSAVRGGGKPDFGRNQAGATLGGPLVRDRAFFFLAYDQQASDETRQATRHVANPANLERLGGFLQTRWPGLFDDEFGPIRRTDDARSLLGKLDLNLDGRHQASFKYNYTWAEQVNGTFDVDSWGASSNGIEGDESNAFNGSLRSLLTNALSNELRIQWAREDRPRWYQGPLLPGARHAGPPQFDALGGRPFPDISMDFADGFRIGLPFFLPIEPVVRHAAAGGRQRLVRHRQSPLQGGAGVQPDPRRAAVRRAGERPLHLRFGRRLHRLRRPREQLRHLLGRILQHARGLSGGSGRRRAGSSLPAGGDRARRSGRAAWDGSSSRPTNWACSCRIPGIRTTG